MRQARLVCLWLALAVAVAPPVASAEVIANRDYPKDAIARSLLRGVFGMRVRAWPDGRPVRVYVLEDSDPVHQEFCKTVLQMYPYQLRENWDRLLYSGTGQPPVMVTSQEELLRRVAETPGAIGYVDHWPAGPKSRKPGLSAEANVKVLDVR